MSRITIVSERALELCEKAIEEAKRREAQPRGSTAISERMPAFFPADAHALVHSLANVARRAIKIGGQGQTQVVLSDQELRALEWLGVI